MSQTTQIEIQNRGENLAIARETVQDFIKSSDFPDSESGKIILAIDEALANIVEHAETPDGEAVTIDIEVSADQHVFKVIIKDRAQPYDPTSREEVDLKAHYLAGKRDGLGVHLMQKIMDEVNYSYTPERENCLTMIRKATATSN